MRLNRFAFLFTRAHCTQTANTPSNEIETPASPIETPASRLAFFKTEYLKSHQEPEPGSEPDYTEIYNNREIFREALQRAEEDFRDQEYKESQVLKRG